MSDKQNIRRLAKRILNFLLIILIYVFGTQIPLPFAEITLQYKEMLQHTSLSLLGTMSGANFMHLSIFSIGLNPYMIAMMLIQFLTMTKLFGFDALPGDQAERVQQIIILVLSILQATFLTNNISSDQHFNHNLVMILILVAGSMLVTWLCFMNVKFGLGGMGPIILVNIISSSLPNLLKTINGFKKLPYTNWWVILLIVLSLLMIYFLIAFSHAYYPLETIDTSLPSYAKPVEIRLGLNLGAMMTFMIGMSILTIPALLVPYLGSHSLLENTGFSVTLIFVLAFALFYFFTFMQFEPRDQARNLRNSNGYLLQIRPGKPTQKYLRNLLLVIAFPGALLTATQLTVGLMSTPLFGKYASLAIIPMNMVMVTMFSLTIKDQIDTLLYPVRYDYLMKDEEE